MTAPDRPLRVVQWGTGTAGLRALSCILTNPRLELVGLYVARPERTGRDAGSFVGRPDTGVRATNDAADLLALDPDCLCYMGSFARGGVQDILPFLRAGIDVVTPSMGTLLVPDFAPPEHVEPVMAACRTGGSSFLSTGASPGFCTDYFPMAMLGIVDRIDEVRVQEIADYSTYPVVEVGRTWGFGAAPGDPIPLFENDGFLRSWHAVPLDIAKRLGVALDEIRIVTESSLADCDIDTAFYRIPKGTVANIRFEVQGIVDSRPLIVLEHVNYCDLAAMPAHWPRPNAKDSNLVYRTLVRGQPNLSAEVTLDYPVAAIRTVNAIPAVVAARPGILSGADVAALGSGHIPRRA